MQYRITYSHYLPSFLAYIKSKSNFRWNFYRLRGGSSRHREIIARDSWIDYASTGDELDNLSFDPGFFTGEENAGDLYVWAVKCWRLESYIKRPNSYGKARLSINTSNESSNCYQ